MRKYLFYISILLFFSCDELQENEGSYNYYDYVKYGWVEFLNRDYGRAIEYYQDALLVNDVDENGVVDNMHHSAYVGISWAKTFEAISNLSNYDNSEINSLFDDAIKYMCYYKDTVGEWNTDGNCDALNAIESSDVNASEFYNDITNLSGITFCEEEYCCSDCFINDKKVSFIYFYAYKYYYYNAGNDPENTDVSADLFYNVGVYLALNFLSSTNSTSNLDKNLTYDFNNGKPENNSQFSLDRERIIVLLSQMYLKNHDYVNAATILFNGHICAETINDLDDIDVQSIIDCVDSFEL